jgi:anti-sigma factor RsiW
MKQPDHSRREFVPYPSAHLPDPILEMLAEGTLPLEEQTAAVAHVEACHRCAAEAEGYRTMFEALAQLPHFAPSAGFSDAVMARVVIAQQTSPVPAWATRWFPATRRGWWLFIAALMVPAVLLGTGVMWAFSRSVVPPSVLAQWSVAWLRDATWAGVSRVVAWVAESGVLSWGQDLITAVSDVSTGVLVTLAFLLAIAIPLSAWSLVHLLRIPTGKTAHA